MACLGLEPRAAKWKVQTNPLSYGGTPYLTVFNVPILAPYYYCTVKTILSFYSDESCQLYLV